MSIFSAHKKLSVPSADRALPGRDQTIAPPERHTVLGTPLAPPYPDGMQIATFGLGCFWGAERVFWKIPGVHSTSVGYAGGSTPNPTYREVCSGQTGHTEVVRVVYDPSQVSFEQLLTAFWQGHNPTQGMRQGNDVGTQYRSAIFVDDEQRLAEAKTSRDRYQERLHAVGHGDITTEIDGEREYFFAEDYHQQYLDKNPGGYCGLSGTGVSCPVGVAVS